ncbi:uncharacterized protein P884DRAFT_187392, partial [Thermothelomyces heterothallicus CBS 202.75]|uniref:uncharacterized protein n=1 Tax=Thermothelomyces heterothallicus CBS 202.75 TaxID=1149848 RepID=UPI0037423D80
AHGDGSRLRGDFSEPPSREGCPTPAPTDSRNNKSRSTSIVSPRPSRASPRQEFHLVQRFGHHLKTDQCRDISTRNIHATGTGEPWFGGKLRLADDNWSYRMIARR